ncbi:hypothetical protein OF83DRAFT_545778 [Amylostereum chailletii]|nr:hypothetical protein OF83DRAFT_545778 [Amylostereum chailletii]
MGTNYVFSLQPTFTQGLILGQLSILFLVVVILKYLFLDTTEERAEGSSSYRHRSERDAPTFFGREGKSIPGEQLPESTEWFNTVIYHAVQAYRSKMRNHLEGADGDEVARKRVEEFANRIRPAMFLDPVQIHSVDLGMAAPQLSNARARTVGDSQEPQLEFDLVYTDTISVSLSTAYLFNYPMFAFARLPVSLTISLSLFSCSLVVIPPSSSSPAPALTINVPPTFTLDLKTTSLMGSRAKLADVPKLHELIEHQLRRQLTQRSSIKIPLPGLASVAEVREEIKREIEGSVMT